MPSSAQISAQHQPERRGSALRNYIDVRDSISIASSVTSSSNSSLSSPSHPGESRLHYNSKVWFSLLAHVDLSCMHSVSSYLHPLPGSDQGASLHHFTPVGHSADECGSVKGKAVTTPTLSTWNKAKFFEPTLILSHDWHQDKLDYASNHDSIQSSRPCTPPGLTISKSTASVSSVSRLKPIPCADDDAWSSESIPIYNYPMDLDMLGLVGKLFRCSIPARLSGNRIRNSGGCVARSY